MQSVTIKYGKYAETSIVKNIYLSAEPNFPVLKYKIGYYKVYNFPAIYLLRLILTVNPHSYRVFTSGHFRYLPKL